MDESDKKYLKKLLTVGGSFIVGSLVGGHLQDASYKVGAKGNTIDYKLINKDSMPDIVINDRKNHEQYVLLSQPGNTYEKCVMSLPQTDGQHMVYSNVDKGYYIVETGEFSKTPMIMFSANK